MFGISKKDKIVKVKKQYFDAIVENNKLLSMTSEVLMANLHHYNIASRGNTNNPYNSWELQVAEAKKKYDGLADWGNQLSQRIINLRVALSVPGGISIAKNPNYNGEVEEAIKAEEFLLEFLDYNTLDMTYPRKMAIEAELQGNVLLQLTWAEKDKLPVVNYYARDEYGYVIEATPKNAAKPKLTATYTLGSKETVFNDDAMVFIAFNDIAGNWQGYPTIGGVLRYLENLEKDTMDWRKLNHLFAHPTPHFKCETKDEADAVNAMIVSTGWQVGTAIATNSELKLVGVAGTEVTLLQSAITTGAKVVSGHTGIGIHFLGFANVMSNRATADSMGEPQEVTLQTEISMWQAFYTDLFRKAIRMRNKEINKSIPEDAFVASILPMTDRQWKILREVYMPSVGQNLLSRETYLDNVPGLNVKQEKERIEKEAEEKAKKLEEFKKNNPQEQDVEDDDDAAGSNDNNEE